MTKKKENILTISSLFYNLRQGVKNIFRNSMFSLASVATMTACIFLFGVFFAVIINVRSLVSSIEEEVGITVLFDEGISQEEIDTIGAALGHSRGKTITAIYVRTDMRKKVDDANRKVIDYVLYGKDWRDGK